MSTAPSAIDASTTSLEFVGQEKRGEEHKATNDQPSNKDGGIDGEELEYECPKVTPLKRGDRFYRECHRYTPEFNIFIESRGQVPGESITGGDPGSATLENGNEEIVFKFACHSSIKENTIEQTGPRSYKVRYGGGKAWTLPIDIKGLSPIVLRALEPDVRVLALYDPFFGREVTKADFKAFLQTHTAKALAATLDRAYPKRERVSFRRKYATYFKDGF